MNFERETMVDQKKELPPFNIEEAERFAAKAFYAVEGVVHSCCVDGRYSQAEARQAAFARPGSDAGDLLAVAAALRDLGFEADPGLRQAAFEAAIRAAGGRERFNFHTDDHHSEGVASGCGHLNRAGKEPAAYGLAPEDIQAVFGILAEMKSEGARETVLSGSHEERAVMIVKDPSTSLLHEVDGSQAFVYHEAMHRERLDLIAGLLAAIPEIAEKGLSKEEIFEALLRSATTQTNASLARLAAGSPVYSVEGGESGPVVKQAGHVSGLKQEAAA